ncbi:formylglycine-generating enzyme family protein [uncultured Ruegeria sp.]|uniref:formylglycine-generating enzyme family protein n=1 Tax=uncultured Ruegeria sp. TaxID=259304 RepID=UPI00345C0303
MNEAAKQSLSSHSLHKNHCKCKKDNQLKTTRLPTPIQASTSRRLVLVFWTTLLGLALSTTCVQAMDDDSHAFRDCAQCPCMVPVPGGEYSMGSPDYEDGRGLDEGPVHHVKIPDGLSVSRFEITFDDWKICQDAGACALDPVDAGWGRGSRPVIYVGWYDTAQYLSWLTEISEHFYRLPTEAEWEYFARAGTTGPYHTGAELLATDANWEIRTTADRIANTTVAKTVPVGEYAPNSFGLHDIHGNVSEWVQDCYDKSAYAEFSGYPEARNGDQNCRRVAKGGTSHYSATYARSANRSDFDPHLRSFDVGFRVVRDASVRP